MARTLAHFHVVYMPSSACRIARAISESRTLDLFHIRAYGPSFYSRP